MHSLRDWLTRKQRETRRGRAELKLAERAALWNARPEDRLLPSVRRNGPHPAADQDEGLDRAAAADDEAGGAPHGFRTLGVLVVVAGLVVSGLAIRRRVVEDQQKTTAAGLVQQLLKADTSGVPAIITAMKDYRPWVDPDLKQRLPRLPEDDSHRSSMPAWPCCRR